MIRPEDFETSFDDIKDMSTGRENPIKRRGRSSGMTTRERRRCVREGEEGTQGGEDTGLIISKICLLVVRKGGINRARIDHGHLGNRPDNCRHGDSNRYRRHGQSLGHHGRLHLHRHDRDHDSCRGCWCASGRPEREREREREDVRNSSVDHVT